jgi:hypothetical protein
MSELAPLRFGPAAAIATPVVSPRATTATAPPTQSFGAVLKALGDETARGERLVDRAVRAGGSGVELSSTDVLALQAGVYRYVEVVDLTSKLVDRAAQSVKQVTQGQG